MLVSCVLTDSEGLVCIGVGREGQTVGVFPGVLVDTVGYVSDGHITTSGGKSVKAKSFTRGRYLLYNWTCMCDVL